MSEKKFEVRQQKTNESTVSPGPKKNWEKACGSIDLLTKRTCQRKMG